MRLTVTIGATCKLTQQTLAVWLLMAHATVRNILVLVCMAVHTGHRGMLLGALGQTSIDVRMASRADVVGRIRAVGDLKRLMNQVAYAAAGIVYKSRMRLRMAFRTCRNKAMAGVMAVTASYIRRMLARILSMLTRLLIGACALV